MPDHSNGSWKTTGSKRLNDRPSNATIGVASIVVFLIAVVLRIPSCYESFWVDELHSAWCVWDDLGDVAPRADIGHQSPFYFIGLWLWKQLVGQSEMALRFSSVLATAASCSVLTAGVTLWSRSLIAGTTAGLVLAIETNSIFFGTELRPFAFVVLFASIASLCFAKLAETTTRHERPKAWVGLIIAIMLAGLCQPTSLGALALLPLTLCGLWLVRDHRKLMKLSLIDGLLFLTAAAVGFALWTTTVGESWQQRQTWASFASAKSLEQLWLAWDWMSLWCLPLMVLLATTFVSRKRFDLSVWMLAGVALIGTCAYWLVSWLGWLPIWHRRYFIAVLPLLAMSVGGCVAAVSLRSHSAKIAVLVAIALLGCLAVRQDLHRTLTDFPVALVVRGEDWRGAVDWVRDQAGPEDHIYLESGLIEARAWNMSLSAADIKRASGFGSLGAMRGFAMPISTRTAEQMDFLRYPLRGPYSLRTFQLINADLDLPQSVLYDSSKQIFLIVRQPKEQIDINPTRWGWVHGNRVPSEIQSYGGVTVIAFGAGEQ